MTVFLTRSEGDGKHILWLTRETARRITNFAWRTGGPLSDLREQATEFAASATNGFT
jgi:hypothetical protein